MKSEAAVGAQLGQGTTQSLPELFLKSRNSLRLLLNRQDRTTIAADIRGAVGEIEKAYTEQPDCTEMQRQVARLLLASAADAAISCSTSIASQNVGSPASDRARSMGLLATPAITVLTLVLAASVLAGPAGLNLILALLLGMLGVASSSGLLGRLANRWPISALLTDRASRQSMEADAKVRSSASEAKISQLFTEIEGTLRAGDAAIDAAGRLADEAPTARRRTPEHQVVQFVQDLAEAVATNDAAHALSLARLRLPALAGALGLTLMEADSGARENFVIDGPADGASTRLHTLRPAVLDGEVCLARGYARPAEVGAR